MADARIVTTGVVGSRRLGLQGQLAVAMHRQLAAILGNRLGPKHARYLARPVLNPATGQIDWYAPTAGTARPLAALPVDEAARLADQAKQIASDIAQLADKLTSEGQSAELVGRMLALTLITPGDARAHLYEIGGQPVLTLWAHDTGEDATAADTPAPAVAAAAPPPLPNPTAATPVPPPPPQRAESAALGAPSSVPAMGASAGAAAILRGLIWLVPVGLALLLALLALRACEPLPPTVVEVPGPPSTALKDQFTKLESDEQGLRTKLAELNRLRLTELAQCEAPPPAPPPAPIAAPPKADIVIPPPQPAPKPAIEAPELTRPDPSRVETPPAPPPVAPPPTPKPKPEATVPVAPPTTEPRTAPRPQACNPSYPPGEEPEVVLIVDGSKSMDERYLGPQTRMDLARRSIEHIVKGLPKPIDTALVEFTTCTDVRRDRFYTAPERGDLVREVQRLSPTGGTPLARSLERAGNIVSSDAEATIVVVSDGDDTCGGDPCAVARAIKARKPRVTINVVDLSGESGRATVQCIARATGGKVLSPNSSADVLTKMQQATRQPDVRQCGP